MISVMCLSSKGGTGKTTVAINLAIQLSKKYRTALIDLDIDNSNEATLLGLQGDIEVDYTNRKMVPRDYNGLKVFAMSLYLSRPDQGVTIADPQRRQFVIDAVKNTQWGELDFIIYDMPGGTAVELTSLINIARDCKAILVTQPNQLESCERTIDVLNHYKIPILGIVENMSGSWSHGKPVLCGCGCGTVFSPFGTDTIKEKFPDIPFLGKIPLCAEIYWSLPPTIPSEFEVIQNIISALGVN